MIRYQHRQKKNWNRICTRKTRSQGSNFSWQIIFVKQRFQNSKVNF